jgi:hypothetical protein
LVVLFLFPFAAWTGAACVWGMKVLGIVAAFLFCFLRKL